MSWVFEEGYGHFHEPSARREHRVTEQPWRPMFRTPQSTVTRVLHSPAFATSRNRAGAILEDATALRKLAGMVDAMNYSNAPLSAVGDRVAAAVRFLLARANQLDRAEADAARARAESAARGHPGRTDVDEESPTAARAARERLLVAALDYLITPDDMVPDFRPGGYVDDALLLSWVFGAAFVELEPYLEAETPEVS
jgi:hypothetical protein